MMKRKFIFVSDDGFFCQLYEDLHRDERAIVLDHALNHVENGFLKKLRKAHLSLRINKWINLPFKEIWGRSLDQITWEDNTQYYVVFLSPYPLSVDYLQKLQMAHKIKYILYSSYVWNEASIYNKLVHEYVSKLKFDYIFSYDKFDSEKNGFIYYLIPYSICGTCSDEISFDTGLVARANKGRLELQHSLYQFFEENRLTTDFRLVGVSPTQQLVRSNITYNQITPYTEVVNRLKKWNCVLETIESMQKGPSLRYFEAICYNKKLLTNNKFVVDLPFYNPEYIHIYEKPEDIDVEWVKERIPVDYCYDGRFSPTHLIDKIIELEEGRE